MLVGQSMIASIEWDTSMVLTAILAPVCLFLFGIVITQWQRINELKGDLDTQTTKSEKFSTQAVDDAKQYAVSFQGITQEKDAQIKRQQHEINELHGQLELRPRFGILWDIQLQPHCPACRSPLCDYGQHTVGTGWKYGWQCIKCARKVYPTNEGGGNVPFQWAAEQVRTLLMENSESGSPRWKR